MRKTLRTAEMSRAAGLRYISVFSGIEAASAAASGMGWEALAFSEIEPFPCAVLAERYPGVANLGDITKVDWKKYRGKCDLVVGGSPCQSFSVAGKREGLSGASGLMWEYVRCVREVRPRWFLWENVPGALSSERGEAFRCLLSAMDELGYGMAWRILDAQFFGVAQRRRRLFLVGRLGERPPTEVLFEPDCLRGGPTSSREKRKELTGRAGRGAEVAGFKFSAAPAAKTLGIEEEQANTLTADWHAPAIFSLQGSMIGRSDQTGEVTETEELAETVTSSSSVSRQQLVHAEETCGVVRRLTPTECERLQGFPDGWTRVAYRGKGAEECPDGPRYKALGNSMAVPVMRWIFEGIEMAEACDLPAAAGTAAQDGETTLGGTEGLG